MNSSWPQTGMFLVLCGLLCVGLAAFFKGSSGSTAPNPVLGDILIIAAQVRDGVVWCGRRRCHQAIKSNHTWRHFCFHLIFSHSPLNFFLYPPPFFSFLNLFLNSSLLAWTLPQGHCSAANGCRRKSTRPIQGSSLPLDWSIIFFDSSS